MISLTAVVPATNDPPTLAACLDAIAAADEPPEQVVVVTEGDGPAAARNAGAADADRRRCGLRRRGRAPAHRRVQPDPGSVRCGSGPDSGLRLLRRLPDRPGRGLAFRNLLHHHVHQQGAGEAATFWAGLGAVRADAFRAAGGFDAERYPTSLRRGHRARNEAVAEGGRILLDPLLQGTHLKRWTLSGMVRTDFWQRGVPWVELVLRHRSGASALNLGWRHRVSAAVAVVTALAIVRGKPGTALCGLVTLAALNAELYELLLRRQGPAAATAGVACTPCIT